MPSSSTKRPRRLALLLPLPILALVIIAHLHAPTSKPHQVVRTAAIEERIVVSGRVMSPHLVQLGSLVDGRVAKILAEAGEAVKQDTVIVRLSNSGASAEVEVARARAERTQSELDQLGSRELTIARQHLTRREVELAQAATEYERAMQLFEQQVIPQTDLDSAKVRLAVARDGHVGATTRLESLEKGGASIQSALASLREARAQEKLAEQQLAEHEILAPVDGTLLKRLVEEGDIVRAGQVVFVLGSRGRLMIETHPDEQALQNLRLGQHATVTSDAHPDVRFDASVIWIAPAVEEATGTVEVRLGLEKPPAFLLPNMSLTVAITVGEKNDALVLERQAVRDADKERPWVLVASDKGEDRRDVQLGLRGTASVEIVDGLSKGERVLLPIPEGAKQKVHPWD